MTHKVIDTNVPLTAAGMNTEASAACEISCREVISSVLKGEITVLTDDAGAVILEYRNNMYPDPKGSLAGQFLMYLLMNRRRQNRVQSLALRIDARGNYEDYPDNADLWTSDDPRCQRFDADDKKWVALAAKFKKASGRDAPIVNAADRCWLAFEPQLASAGIQLEALCRDERQGPPPHSSAS